MGDFSLPQAVKLFKKGISSYRNNQPLVVSFEVTLSCNANCKHCDCGGIKSEVKQLKPVDYGKLTRLLNPPVVQISGGEPLLRKDIVDIVRAVKQSDGLPYLIFVTNGSLLNQTKYLQLHEAGVNQFSVSLDFPDERHDEFRRFSGLYLHLDQTIPKLANFGYRDIILNTAITKANFKEILPLARKALEWNVYISYSVYTALRTYDKDYLISTDEELDILRKSINELIELKKQTNHIANPKAVLLNTLRFLEHRHIPNCKAGIRFFCVMPDGYFTPCAMHRMKYSTQKEMIEKFSLTNQCGECYVSIRAYCEQSLGRLLKYTIAQAKTKLFT